MNFLQKRYQALITPVRQLCYYCNYLAESKTTRLYTCRDREIIFLFLEGKKYVSALDSPDGDLFSMASLLAPTGAEPVADLLFPDLPYSPSQYPLMPGPPHSAVSRTSLLCWM
jgi:hypothetical protein